MDFVVEELHADAEAIGLTKRQLRTDVELKLRTAGVKLVADPSVRHESGAAPNLYLYVGVLHKPEIELVAYRIGLEFHQWGTFDGGFEGLGTTWRESWVGTRGEARDIRDAAGDLVDMFLNDYLKANPRH